MHFSIKCTFTDEQWMNLIHFKEDCMFLLLFPPWFSLTVFLFKYIYFNDHSSGHIWPVFLLSVCLRSATGKIRFSLNRLRCLWWFLERGICLTAAPSLLRFISTVLRFCLWRVKHTFIWLSTDKPTFYKCQLLISLSLCRCVFEGHHVCGRQYVQSSADQRVLWKSPKELLPSTAGGFTVCSAHFTGEICLTHFAGALCPAHFTGKLCHTHFAGALCPAHFTGERCPTHFRSQMDMQHSVYFESWNV